MEGVEVSMGNQMEFLPEMEKVKDSMDKQLESLPQEVKFCTRCVVSTQRPRIVLDEEGVCSACRFAEAKRYYIDWKERAGQLKELCDRHRRTDGRYDMIVPGSGGKDSASVAHKLKHIYGMHPLTITWAPFIYTDIGWKNYYNFIHSGFGNIMAWPNGRLHRKLARIAFEIVGDVFLPFIYGQMAFAFHMALRFEIKLVFYGENGEAEYGGVTRNNDRPSMPLEDWVEVYFKGATVDDLIEWGLANGVLTKDDYDESDLTFYRPPRADELQGKGIQMHWFSYYHKWVPQENFYYTAEHTGFQANPERSEGTYSKYASLDDRLDGFHFYFAFLKFGLGRCTQDAAHEIRDGHITRQEAVALVNRYDGEFPKKYFSDLLSYLDITEEKFWQVVDKFRPPHLWAKVDGEWRLKHRVSNL